MPLCYILKIYSKITYLALIMNTKAKKNIKNLSFFAKYKSQIVSITSKEHISANKVCI